MCDAAATVPLIEPDPQAVGAPPGYRWYLIRDWNRVLTGKASGVTLAPDPDRASNPLQFEVNGGDTLRQHRPAYAGQISRVLLPVSFELPPSLKTVLAQPPPSTIPAEKIIDLRSLRFREETPGTGVAPGSHAITFVVPGQVFTGVATRFTMKGRAFHLGGSGLHVEESSVEGEASHVILAPGVVLPEAVERLPKR